MNEIEVRMYKNAELVLAAYLEIHTLLKSDDFSSIRNLCIKSQLDASQLKEGVAALDGPYGHSRGWCVDGKHDLSAGPTIQFRGGLANKLRFYRP